MNKIVSRRKFIDLGVKAGLVAPAALAGLSACSSPENKSAITVEESEKLNILILGGTSFLGPHQVAYALQRGHNVTIFTRGRTLPTIHQELFERVTSLTGDRANDLAALETGSWDAVIDNSGQRVAWARDSAELLRDRAGLYLYTSSTGVYYPYLDQDIREDHELVLAEPVNVEDEEMELEYRYGVMKANSEIAVKEAFGKDRTIIVRPTYMIGPADKSNRFIHWPLRLSQAGEVLVPGKADDPVQYVDVRDIAEWMIRLLEQKNTGTFNGVGPDGSTRISDFVAEASTSFDISHDFVQVDDYEFLKTHGITSIVPWIMPTGNNWGSARINNEAGIANGLTFRELKHTVADTYEWWQKSDDPFRDAFLNDDNSLINKEAAILTEWHAQR